MNNNYVKEKYIYAETITQEFRLKNTYETRHYFIEEIKQIDLVSKKHEKFFMALNYMENLSILAFLITEFLSISAFSSLFAFPIDIVSSSVGS